jgi:TPR repeat protein
MRIIVTGLALLVLAALPARADMASAQQAYANGEFTRALELWQEEAYAGNGDAAWYVGNMFIDGLGLDRPDAEMAAIYYQMGAEDGHIEAKVSLGLLYGQGRGVEQDFARAMSLLYEAALEEHPVAMVEIANYFLDGVDGLVQQSEAHAYEWYGLAARRGVVFAQIRFGQMHYLGLGAPENQEEGLKWLAVAREVALSRNEPYWSARVFPLDDTIGEDEDGNPQSLRDVAIGLFDEYAAEVSPEVADDARQAALAWIAERAN